MHGVPDNSKESLDSIERRTPSDDGELRDGSIDRNDACMELTIKANRTESMPDSSATLLDLDFLVFFFLSAPPQKRGGESRFFFVFFF